MTEPAGGTAIRRASVADAVRLSEVALRSKAIWGYDAGFIEACRAELTIAPAAISQRSTYLVEDGGAIAGFYQLRIAGESAEITHLFVAPGRIGAGLGRRLWAHLEARRASACRRLEVDADPHAAGFYRAMGMVECGAAPSGSIPGRMLPRLTKDW